MLYCAPTHTFNVNYFTKHYITVTLQKSSRGEQEKVVKEAAMNIQGWISSKVTCNVTFCLEHLERNANLHETLSICIVNEMINVTYIY